MKKIVCFVQPFEAKQKMDVLEDSEIVETFSLDTFNLLSTLPVAAHERNVDIVMFGGPKVYLEGVISRFNAQEVKNYSKETVIKYSILGE